jgi:hypothetical protein
MSMDDRVAGEPLQFILIDKTPSSDLKLVCQAPSDEVKDNWTSQLRSILDMQGNLLRGTYVIPRVEATEKFADVNRPVTFCRYDIGCMMFPEPL